MADLAYVLEEAHAPLGSVPNIVVRTPTGLTTIKDIAGHAARLLHRLSPTRRRRQPVTAFELAACLKRFSARTVPAPLKPARTIRSRLALRCLLDRWNGRGTNAALCSAPPSPATTKETI
jgi:hypothetical protein